MEKGYISWGPVRGSSCLDASDLVPYETTSSRKSGEAIDISLNCLSANVQSMWQKHKYIEEQCVSSGIDIFMAQETKMHGGYCETAIFHRFSSHSHGHWGTDVWIAKRLRGNGKNIPVNREDTTLIPSEPRMLAVHVHIGGLNLLAISARVPHRSRPQEERDQTFATLSRTIETHGGNAAIIVGIDANARVPAEYLQTTGGLLFGEPDDPGWQFVEVSGSNDLWLPSTCSCRHHGGSATWTHSGGNESRIDYIAVEAGLMQQLQRPEWQLTLTC